MPNLNPRSLAMKMLSSNARMSGNMPNQETMEMIDIIRTNDSRRGEALANKILKQYGITKEQAMQMAAQQFHM